MAVPFPSAPIEESRSSPQRIGLERWLPLAVLAVTSLSTVAVALLLFRPAGLLFAPRMPSSARAAADFRSLESLGRVALLVLLVAGQSSAATLLLLFQRDGGLARRGGGPGSQPDRSARSIPGEVAWLMVASAAASALAAAWRFRFRMDDFSYLRRAEITPFSLDHAHRMLTTMAHFQVGVQLGHGHGWFAAVNLAVLAVMCGAWAALVRRAGLSRNASLVAAGLFALAPGTLYLVKTANGIEHLGSAACVVVTMLLVDLAARGESLPWRLGMLSLALSLSMLGVLMKHQLMFVLPPSCWFWGRWVVADPKSPFDRSVTYLAFAAAIAVPLLLLPADPSPAPIAFRPWIPAWLEWWSRLERYALVVAVLYAVAVAAAFGRHAFGAGSRRAAIAVERDRVSALVRASIVPAGRIPLIVWALVLSAVWCAPFQLNAGRIGMDYYAMLMSAPAGALAAALIDAIEFPARRWIARTAVAAAVVVVLFPARAVYTEIVATDADDALDRWFGEIHDLVREQPAPDALVVELDCGFDGQLGTSGTIDGFFAVEGLRWATGWQEVPVSFRREGDGAVGDTAPGARTATLHYCPGEPATFDARAKGRRP